MNATMKGGVSKGSLILERVGQFAEGIPAIDSHYEGASNFVIPDIKKNRNQRKKAKKGNTYQKSLNLYER